MTDHWYAVCLSRQLGKRPKRVYLNNMPIVLFRNSDGVQALVDRCPHRFAALSDGAVRHDEIECPYHGWRFDGQGLCTGIPGHIGPCPTIRVQRFQAAEAQGAIFVSLGSPVDAPFTHSHVDQDVICRLAASDTSSSVLDVAENILDATHTHFTHKGLLRGLSSRRHKIDVAVTGGPDWVEARYTGEPRQDGVVSRLLEGARVTTIGRFRAPGVAELEYWGPKGLALATTFHLRQAQDGIVSGIAWLIGPRQRGLGHVKALAFRPMFTIALNQDRRVLHSASANAALAPGTQPAIGPLDILRTDIQAILQGKAPSAATSPRYVQMTL